MNRTTFPTQPLAFRDGYGNDEVVGVAPTRTPVLIQGRKEREESI
jgi:hypothetical protein